MKEIRRLTADDLDDVFALDQFAFQFELSETAVAERRERVKPADMTGYFVNDRLAAKMTVLPLETVINCAVFSMGGIASVATWPEYRRQGMVAKLLVHALSEMRTNGQSISFLHPFSFAFYRKFGWETYVDFKKYTIEVANLPDVHPVTGSVQRSPDWQTLNEVYESYAQAYNGMLKRDQHWWRIRVLGAKKAQSAVCYNAENEPRGYLLYDVKNHEMTIQELVFLDESARGTLWAFIRNHDSMIDRVTLKAPSSDQLTYLLSNPRIKQEVLPYFMARIVDVKTFLERYPFSASSVSHSFRLQINDTFAPWNNCTFEVAIVEDGSASVETVQASEAHVSCDIQTLTTMLMGYQRPSFLHSIGRLAAESHWIEQLEQRIPHRTTYLADFF